MDSKRIKSLENEASELKKQKGLAQEKYNQIVEEYNKNLQEDIKKETISSQKNNTKIYISRVLWEENVTISYLLILLVTTLISLITLLTNKPFLSEISRISTNLLNTGCVINTIMGTIGLVKHFKDIYNNIKEKKKNRLSLNLGNIKVNTEEMEKRIEERRILENKMTNAYNEYIEISSKYKSTLDLIIALESIELKKQKEEEQVFNIPTVYAVSQPTINKVKILEKDK